ncbi:MAG TPA: hypothetical protein VLE19_11735 [Pyrinomonadaceae bacterium]|nr:hypothetical protein [Pyrinomonadaceae bacterium]
MNRTERKPFRIAALLVLLTIGGVTASAQVDSVVGKYVGAVKVSGSPDAEIVLELAKNGDKITGELTNGQAKLEITEGTLSEGKLTLKLGQAAKDGMLTAKVDGAVLKGEWLAGTEKRTIELKRVAEAATGSEASLDLNGQWDGVADAEGQPFPFLLTLKIEGESVSGASSSQLGEAKISNGSWKDGRLNFQLDGSSGVITMSAVVVDGKLSGEFDYAGQAQGKWVAIKKK